MIDREIAPIWHDRFARLIVRNLPGSSDVIALDIHCGVGRTTAELLARLGPAARVLAIEPDDTLIEMAKTRMRPEWKNRVYLKPGNFDDVAAMADDSYNLVVANLVLGDTGDIGTALAEMVRVNRIGGRILATLPLAESWHEVEDIFAEVLRDAGLTAAVRRLERLRELRPTGAQLAEIVRRLGVAEDDFVIEQERFQMLFPSGREFLFAPVVEHGPLRLWKAVIGKDGSPQELFWRLKEAIDTYYTGHVLAVNVLAGLMNIHVAKGTESPGPRLAARYWRHYPGLDALWGGLAAGYVRVSEPSLPPFGDVEFDFDIQIDDGEARRTGAQKPVTTSIPIVTDDLYDAEPALAAPAIVTTPVKPTRAEAGSARRSAEPARALSTLKKPPAPQPRPPVAEDDFSDINDLPDPTATFRAQEVQAAPSVPPAEPDEPEESTDPTSTFNADDLRAARLSQPHLAARPEPEPDEPTPPIAAATEPEATEPEPEATEPETTQPEATEPETTEPAATELTTAPAPDESEPAPEANSELSRLPVRSPLQDGGTLRRVAEPSPLPAFRPPPTSESGKFQPPTAAEPSPLSAFRPATSESGKFQPPTAEPAALPAFRPPSTSESGKFQPPTAAEPSPLPAFRPPSTSESGKFQPPTAETTAAEPARRPAPESSGLTPRPPSSESSGFTPRPASSESSGLTPRPASSESSGFTPRPASSESSGFTPRPGASFLRPSRSGDAVTTTGSFNVFAPPKPRLSEETAGKDGEAEPIAADTIASSEPAPASAQEPASAPAPNVTPSLSAALADLTVPADAPATDAEELDELEDAEALEDDEPVAARPAAAPPPRPKAPPPPPSGAFKPRALLPIVPPKKK